MTTPNPHRQAVLSASACSVFARRAAVRYAAACPVLVRGRAALFLVLFLAASFAGCGGESDTDVAEVIRGSWKNGDGSLMRFMEEGRAAIGQEGLEGEGACEYEVEGDSVRLVTLPESPGDPRNIFEFHYSGDTLYMTAVTLLRPGERTRFSQEELPALLGKPMYKLHFTRTEETP